MVSREPDILGDGVKPADTVGHIGELDCTELKEAMGVKDDTIEEEADIWLDALSDTRCNADWVPTGVTEADGNGDAEPVKDSLLELEIVWDTLRVVEEECDVRGDAEFVCKLDRDTRGVSELDDIHDTVFRDDTEGIFVTEVIGVSDTVDDIE